MTFKLGLGLAPNNTARLIPYNEVEGLAFHMDMSNPSGYNLNGSAVDDIYDLSGNGHDFTRVTAGQYDATGLNGQPTLDFAATVGGYRAQHAAFKTMTGMTVIAVMQTSKDWWTGTTGEDLGWFLCVGTYNTTALTIGGASNKFGDEALTFAHWSSSSETKATGVSARRYRAEVGDEFLFGFRTGANGSKFMRGDKNIPLGHYTFDTNYFSTANTSTDFSPNALSVTEDWVGLGYLLTNTSGGGARESDYKISEMLIYDRDLSDTEYASIVKQLHKKWGLSSQSTTPTFLIAGQSNAVGHGTAPTSNPDYTSAVAGSELFTGLHTRTDLTAGTAEALNTSSHGVEIPISRKYNTDIGANVVLKSAAGGTSLAVDWKPTPTYGATLQTALDGWDRCLLNGQMAGNGYNPDVKALFWIQGEQDATDNAHANAYESNLTALINLIRSRYGHFPIIIAEINTNLGGSFPYDTTVLNAQRAVAAAIDDVYLVNTQAITPIGADGVHYNSDQLIEIGEKALAAMTSLSNQVCTNT